MNEKKFSDDNPIWFDGKKINEALFCDRLLAERIQCSEYHSVTHKHCINIPDKQELFVIDMVIIVITAVVITIPFVGAACNGSSTCRAYSLFQRRFFRFIHSNLS